MVFINKHMHPSEVIPACEDSLHMPGLDYLDLFVVHWPWPNYHAPGASGDSMKEDAEFVQLCNLKKDPAETTNVAEQHPDIVKELFILFSKQVENGWTRQGEPLQNAVPVQTFKQVPGYVFENRL